MPRPGCVVRTALATFGLIFLPMGIWFAWKAYWGNAVALGLIAVVFLRLGLSRDENSWMSAIDDLDDTGKRSLGESDD